MYFFLFFVVVLVIDVCGVFCGKVGCEFVDVGDCWLVFVDCSGESFVCYVCVCVVVFWVVEVGVFVDMYEFDFVVLSGCDFCFE